MAKLVWSSKRGNDYDAIKPSELSEDIEPVKQCTYYSMRRGMIKHRKQVSQQMTKQLISKPRRTSRASTIIRENSFRNFYGQPINLVVTNG